MSKDDQQLLIRPITDDEIEKIVFGLKKGKAPGSDGFPIKFYRDVWSIIKPSVCEAVKTYFATSYMSRYANSTALTLISKTEQPQTMKKIKHIFEKVVGIQQTTYVSGRRITDGILLMQEFMSGYNRTSGKPRCAIKIDIMKAYDIIKWKVLWKVLEVLDFPMCITAAWFSISLNGSLHGFFPSSRGLRHGNPLSPYLFFH
ncbi:hypothetical protein LIER_16473 [Lithospermum erythrorhizon]|uniref:Reverse transcriptase domain-containing protein n=1 Tax=Lithospermum erythrorhizon TaxID=34254 RepID=A0AAV3QBA6_LITER